MYKILSVTLLVLSLPATTACAESFNFSDGTRAAELDVAIVSGDLQLTLTNTSSFDVLVPIDVLTAVYFDISGNPSLIPSSAMLGAGSSSIYDTVAPTAESNGGDVGGEWAYREGISTGVLPDDQSYGISSTGLGVFGTGDGTLFSSVDLEGPANVNGLQYGIVSAGDDPATGNGGVKNTGGLIQNSVVFTLTGLGAEFSLDQISNVRFQYGTALYEPSFPSDGPPDSAPPVVPEPSSWVLLCIGAAGLTGITRRRRRKKLN